MVEVSGGVSGASQAYNSSQVRNVDALERDRKAADDSDIERREAERSSEARARDDRRSRDSDRGRNVDIHV